MFVCNPSFLDRVHWLHFFSFHHSRRVSGHIPHLICWFGAWSRGEIQNVHIYFLIFCLLGSWRLFLAILQVHELVDDPVDRKLSGVVNVRRCSMRKDISFCGGFVIRCFHNIIGDNKIINGRVGNTYCQDPKKETWRLFIKISIEPIYPDLFSKIEETQLCLSG